jgi:methionine synthase I (cobalamin-dependent)/5,10-methylenetetrahydrofolate reductase
MEEESMTEERVNAFQKLLGDQPVLCDGAMGTMLYARGVFISRCYDELNLSQPDMVRGIHESYLQAGAEVLETNTFGANRFRLARHGLEHQVEAINTAAVKLARQAADFHAEKQAKRILVAGAVGPLGVRLEPLGKTGLDEARAAFGEQMAALAAAGADLIMLETMPSLSEAHQAILAAREVCNLPILAMVTVDEEGNCLDGAEPETAAARLTEWGADAVGCNCSTGPATVLSVIERMRAATDLPLAAMPNAGVPRAVDGRNIYLTSPEYMASFARKFVRAGAQIIGGCCGTTPEHIRAMRSALRAIDAKQTASVVQVRPVTSEQTPPPPLKERSKLGKLLAERAFVTMVEIVSPRGVSPEKEVEGAAMLARHGVNIINVPDSPRASARMSAQALCLHIQREAGIETLLHYTCRDRNVLSMQSDLLGAASLGLKNILCVTGDPPKLGNYPDATAVFDVDSIGLVNLVHNLNYGLDLGANGIGSSGGFTIGVGANPGAADFEQEVRRFAYKVEAGAEFAVTQPVFDLRLLELFLERIAEFRIPIVAGIWPLTSVRNAEFMKNDLRVSMPDEILRRMQAASGSPEEARAEGVAIAREMLEQVQESVEGVQVSAPFGRYQVALDVLEALHVPVESTEHGAGATKVVHGEV